MTLFKRIFGLRSDHHDQSSKKRAAADLRLEDEFQHAIAVLAKYRRTAYLPIIRKAEPQFSAKSKIGGLPYLRNPNDWPVCKNCHKNMPLLLQLNLPELPEKQEAGIIQLFYCTSTLPHCESDLEAFFPFSNAVECRKIQIKGESAFFIQNPEGNFEEKTIIGWEPKDDYPHPEEYEHLNIELFLNNSLRTLMENREQGLPISKDKLFGWPYWVQTSEYPLDRQTKTQMELLFQLVSEGNLPYMFGDSGIGYLTQSQDNGNELGFGWACS